MKSERIAIITGDIIHSRRLAPDQWLDSLKTALHKINPEDYWSVFRGDAFQVKTEPERALSSAIYLKACIKAVPGADVRMAIGIGDAGVQKESISESNGEAYVLSGSKLETLKKERQNLAVHTPSADFNHEMNTIIRLALVIMDAWTPTSAKMIKLALEQENLPQNELARLSGKSQSSVSETLRRAHFSEIMELNTLYQNKLSILAL